MSLSKLWNSKYLLQNIKKSKMAIVLFFTFVPIFTSLLIIAEGGDVLGYDTFASVNILGLYFIPVIFSVCLFGYVFKKNSVDFMGSMPISRGCIFVTNTVGGIVLIVLMQIITFALTLIVSSLTNGVLFLNMAWDVFVYQTIAYIFVFTSANLAMTFSGTVVAQMALTLLIVFTIPFSSWYVNVMCGAWNGDVGYTLVNEGTELMQVDKAMNYTGPFLLFSGSTYGFNVLSIIKMAVLSIIYFALGFYFFKKKKMETASESFENKYIHLVIKGLTLLPFVAIFKSLISYEEWALGLIVFAIIVTYYFVFDLITSKKIKIVDNIISLIASVAVIYGMYSIAITIDENIDKTVDLSTIKSASFEIDNRFFTKTEDKNKIDSTIIALSEKDNKYVYDYAVEKEEDYENNRNYGVKIKLENNFGEKFEEYVYINKEAIVDIFDESFKNVEISDNAAVSNYNLKLTKAEKKEIIKEIRNSLNNLSAKQVIDVKDDWDFKYLFLSEYIDHEFIEIYYPTVLNERVQEIVTSAYNRYAGGR